MPRINQLQGKVEAYFEMMNDQNKEYMWEKIDSTRDRINKIAKLTEEEYAELLANES